MRKNTFEILSALAEGKHKECSHKGNGPAVWTDGKVVYSYREPIAAPDPENPGGYVVTDERFSQTTTVQTNGVDFGLSYHYKKPTRRVPHAEVKAAAKAANDS